VERAGLQCVRADQECAGHIHRQMFERIFDSPVVVADISGGNANVFYELGVAHCTGRKTVTVAREDFKGQVPFDIAPYRVLLYPKAPAETAPEADRAAYRARAAAAVEALAAELARIAGDPGQGIANPVQDYLTAQSPLTATQSRHHPPFGSDREEEMLRQV